MNSKRWLALGALLGTMLYLLQWWLVPVWVVLVLPGEIFVVRL